MTILNIVILGASYPLYIHYLGYEKYGVWLVLTTILTFAAMGNLGIGTAVTKLIAEEYGKDNTSNIHNYVSTAILMLFISGLVVLLIIMLFSTQIVSTFKLDEDNKQMVAWLLPYIGFLCIYSFIAQVFEATLCGLNRMDLANYIRTFSHATQVIISGILLASGTGVIGMLIGSIAFWMIIHILNAACIYEIIRLKPWKIGNIKLFYFSRLLNFGGTLFFGSAISMLFNPFNKLMLSRYAGVATLPLYEIAYTGGMLAKSLIESGLRALLPKISNLSADIHHGAIEKISKIYKWTIKIIFIFGTPIYILLFLMASFLLKIWLGNNFNVALPGLFQTMLIGSYISLLSVPAYYTLMGLSNVRSCLISQLIACITNFILVIFIARFTHALDARHVVFATILGMIFSSLYLINEMNLLLKRR